MNINMSKIRIEKQSKYEFYFDLVIIKIFWKKDLDIKFLDLIKILKKYHAHLLQENIIHIYS